MPGGWARIARLAGPPPRATVPAAPVKQREAHAVRPAHLGDGRLGLVQRPVGGQVAAVFVAVRIADHDHLLVAARAQVLAVNVERKQVRPGSAAPHPGRPPSRTAARCRARSAQPAHCASSSTVSTSAGAARHRDDERAQQLRPIHAARARHQPKQRPGFGGLHRHAWLRRQPRRRLGQQAQQQPPGAGGVVALLRNSRSSLSARSSSPSAEASRAESSRTSSRAACRPKISNCCRTRAARRRPTTGGTAAAIGRQRLGEFFRPHAGMVLRRTQAVGRSCRRCEASSSSAASRASTSRNGLVAVALLQICHVRRQRPARLQPGLQRQRQRHAPVAHAQPAGSSCRRARCRSTARPRCRRSVSAVTAAVTLGLPSRSPPIQDARVSQRGGEGKPG